MSTLLFAALAAALLAISSSFTTARWPAFLERGPGSVLRLDAGAGPAVRAPGTTGAAASTVGLPRLVAPGPPLLAGFAAPGAAQSPSSASPSASRRAGRGGGRRSPRGRRQAGRPTSGPAPDAGGAPVAATPAPAPVAAVAPPPAAPAKPARRDAVRGPKKAKPHAPARGRPDRPASVQQVAEDATPPSDHAPMRGGPPRSKVERGGPKPHPAKAVNPGLAHKPEKGSKDRVRGAGRNAPEQAPGAGGATIPPGAVL